MGNPIAMMKAIFVLAALAAVTALPTDETTLVSGVDPSTIVPEPEATYDAHQDAVETVLAMLQEGKGANACNDLADATEKEVTEAVKAEQDLLNKLDRGQDCPKSGQSAVDLADSALQAANGEASDAAGALSKAQNAQVNWGSSSFNSVTKGNCNVFYTSAAYKSAEKAMNAAKNLVNQKNGAATALAKALAKARTDQKALIKKCQCSTYKNHQDKRAAAHSKAWTKAAHLKCVLAGTAANACAVPKMPVVTNSAQLAAGVNANACEANVGTCGPKLSTPSKTFKASNGKTWLPCYVARNGPAQYKKAAAYTLVPQGVKRGTFGAWHYNGCATPFASASCQLKNACRANMQESTSYTGWGGNNHILVVCIPQ